MDVPLIIGITGMALLLLAFVLNLFKKLEEGSPKYVTLNFVGGMLMALYAYLIVSMPFFVLNAVWGISAGYRLAENWMTSKGTEA